VNPSVDGPQKAGILLNNLVPVLGVILFSWPVASVLFMYWLDGWLCFVELGTLAMIVVSREPDWPLAGFKGLKRLLYYAAATVLLFFLLSVPSLVAGGAILAILDDNLINILGSILGDRAILVGIGVTVVCRGFNISRRMAGHGVQDEKLGMEQKGELFFHRTVVMMMLAGMFGQHPGAWMLKIIVLAITALFTLTEMQPERYLVLVGIVRKKSKAGPAPKNEA
jgi:hypothetical protein